MIEHAGTPIEQILNKIKSLEEEYDEKFQKLETENAKLKKRIQALEDKDFEVKMNNAPGRDIVS